MSKPIQMGPFKGMNNTQGPDGDPKMPRTILNADSDQFGAIHARQGKQLIESLPGAHSIWANEDVAFVAAQGTLYRFYPKNESLSELTGLNGDGPVYYATVRTDHEQSVYISAPGMMGRFDLQAQVLDTWGQAVPPRPRGSLIEGNLEPGHYTLCYTRFRNGKMSANGEAETFTVGEGQGIFLANVADCHVWITDPGGGELQHLGRQSVITEQPVGGEPLPVLGAAPPDLGLTCIWWFAGRMWGFKGTKLVYSLPFDPELFYPTNFIDLGESGVMMAPTTEGVYVATSTRTEFFHGKDPKSMRRFQVGSGAVKNTLAYVKQLGELGSNVPVWMTEHGVVAGSREGQLVNLTQRKVKMTPPKEDGESAATAREHNGDVQYLASYKRKPSGTAASFGDKATAEVVRNGRVLEEKQ